MSSMYIVVTLAEGKYVEGALVLFNSLVANGFVGKFIVGVRSLEDLPSKVSTSITSAIQKNIILNDQLSIICAKTNLHYTNFKPRFMLDVFDSYPDCRVVAYLDPDILCLGDCNWILNASADGPVVAADVNWQLPRNHPTRYAWHRLISKAGKSSFQDFDYYFNGGMLVLNRKDKSFLELWYHYILAYGSIGAKLDAVGEISSWRNNSRANPMFSPDQDALNMAMISWPGAVCTFGPDMMGFSHGDTYLPHAIGSIKPWNKAIMLDTLRGNPPRLVDKSYWKYSDTSVRVYTRSLIVIKRLQIRIASFIGRFYRRV